LAEAKVDLLAAQADRARSKQAFDVAVDWASLEAQMQAEVLSVIQAIYDQANASVKAEVDSTGLQVAWDIYDAQARDQALAYGYTLIKQINESTREQIGKAIARWIETDQDFEALVDDIWKLVPTNPFPNMHDRARVIAQTETTRVYAHSRLKSFEAAGLKRQRWRTAMDELVCPLCGPLGLANEQQGAVGEHGTFIDPTTGEKIGIPPRHVNCRCWIVEDLAELTELLTLQGEGGPQPKKPAQPKKPKKPKNVPPSVPSPTIPWKPAMTLDEAAQWTWGPYKDQQFYAQAPAAQWAKIKAGGLPPKYLDLKTTYSKPVGMTISMPVQVNVRNPLIVPSEGWADVLEEMGFDAQVGMEKLGQEIAAAGYDAVGYVGSDGSLTGLTVLDPSNAVVTVNRYGKPSSSTWKPPKKKTPGKAALPAGVPESEPANRPAVVWQASMTQADADAWVKGSALADKTYFNIPNEGALQNGIEMMNSPVVGKYTTLFEEYLVSEDVPVKVKVNNPYPVTHPSGTISQAVADGWDKKTPLGAWLKNKGYDSVIDGNMVFIFDASQAVYIDADAAVLPTVAKAPQVFPLDAWDIDHDLLLSRDLHDDGLWGAVKKGKRTTSYGAAVFDDNGRVLLRRPKGEFGGYAWTFPKGGIEPTEHPLTAALREVAEETGHEGQVIGLLSKPYKGGTTNTYMAIMRSKTFDASLMDMETEEIRWVSKEEAAELIQQGSNKAGVKRDLAILEDAFGEFEALQDASHRAALLNRIQQAKAAPVKTPLPPKRQPEQQFRWKADELISRGRVSGATHEALLYDAPDGSRWMFKPQEEFLAYNDRATYRMAGALGHEAAETHVVTIGGRVGSMQRWYTEASTTVRNTNRLTPAQTVQAQKEALFDWLISNHDGHDGNLLVLDDGRLVGIDKGQAFKFWGKDRLDWDYNPNSNVNVYSWHNKTLRAYAAGQDVRLFGPEHAEIKGFINRIEGLDDGEFQAILRPYAEKALAAGRLPGRDIDAFLAAATDRKNNIGKDWRALYEKAEAARRKALGLPEPGRGVLTPVDARLVADIKRSGFQGKSLLFGGADIENMTGLIYEIEGDGTVIEFKVRKEAEGRMFANLGDLPVSTTAAPKPNVSDPYWSDVQKVAVSYNHHYKPWADQIVPQYTKENTKVLLAKLQLRSDGDPIAAYYLDYIVKLDEAIAAGDKGMFGVLAVQYTPPPPAKEERPETRRPRRVDVTAVKVSSMEVRNENGRIIQTPGRQRTYSGKALNIVSPSGTLRLNYIPHANGNDSQYAKQGMARIIIDGKATEENIQEALTFLGDIGLNNRLATPQDVEWMYLIKTTYAAGGDLSSIVTASATVSQQTEELKRYWNKRLGVADVTKLPSYQPRPHFDSPAPVLRQKDGEFGIPRWRRFDITVEDLQREMPGYALQHNLNKLYGGGPSLSHLEVILNNNGSLISNEEKARLGVFAREESKESDEQSGGSTYAFTRIAGSGWRGASAGNLFFDPVLLLDTDVVSYRRDYFGKSYPEFIAEHRQRTIDGWKKNASSISNETNVKRGVSLVDYLISVRAQSETERKEIIKLFKSYGITHLQGTPVEDAVWVKRS